MNIFGWKIRINPAKWVRRQGFGGQPITAGSILDKALETLDFNSAGDVLLAFLSGQLTVNIMRDKLTAEARDVLSRELRKVAQEVLDAAQALKL